MNIIDIINKDIAVTINEYNVKPISPMYKEIQQSPKDYGLKLINKKRNKK
jgi:hypothetical protein